jgi:hypothetical protein
MFMSARRLHGEADILADHFTKLCVHGCVAMILAFVVNRCLIKLDGTSNAGILIWAAIPLAPLFQVLSVVCVAIVWAGRLARSIRTRP